MGDIQLVQPDTREVTLVCRRMDFERLLTRAIYFLADILARLKSNSVSFSIFEVQIEA